jgi:CheY-like chemotaxis protein
MSASVSESKIRPLIVVVEDNENTNQLLRDWLRLTYRVTPFLDAETTLSQIDLDQVPDAFVIDYKLPAMDGLALKKQLGSQFPAAKYVMISGIFDDELQKQAMESGFHALLPKPFNLPALSKKLQQLLGYPPAKDLTAFVK